MNDAWAYEAWCEINSGQAQQYKEEYCIREEILCNSPGEDVELLSYSEKPEILFFDDITKDPEDWKNQAMANYYDLGSVVRVDIE